MLVKTMPGKIGALFIPFILALGACSPLRASTTSEVVAVTTQEITLPTQASTQAPAIANLRPIQIADAQVEIGVGSPIPVEVVASGTWPDLCAQVAQVNQQLSGARFEIEILASAADPACPPDPVGIPFRMAIPLNMVNLPPGAYTVAVNGFETSFEWQTATSEPIPVENLGLTVAYIGADGNLWLADASGGPPRQITSDAATIEAEGEVISYYFPSISSDGRYLAARRDAGVPIPEGLRYQFSLMVYDTETGEGRPVYEDADSPPADFDWKPGTHVLAYGLGSDPNYFTTRGEKPDPALLTGIFGVDLDTGETSVLVKPENGYSLLLPIWSPDGRFLSFDELINMEGRGLFSYYDFEAQQYIAWGEILGNYDWSPDGSQLVYDRLSYAPGGTERIFTRPRLGGTEQQVSPDPDQGYASFPVFSPDGLQIAYLIDSGGPERTSSTLVVQSMATGELRELGRFESVFNLDWSADGKALVFSAGPYESQQVYAYNLTDGTLTTLAEGSQPTLAGP